MTASRMGRSPVIPFAAMKNGRPVLASHAMALGQAINELAFNGRTVFFNPCRTTLTASGGTVTSGLYRHKVPLTRFGLYRMWVVAYSTENASVGGLIKITPTIAPTAGTGLGQASHTEWSRGKQVETLPVGGSRRFANNLFFIEKVNTGSYTLPSASHDLSYTLTWTLTTSGGTDVLIRHVACYELDELYDSDGGTAGVDTGFFRPFAAVFTGGNTGERDEGIGQIAYEIDRLKSEHDRRWLWGTAYPATTLASGATGIYEDIFDVQPRVHPPRYGRVAAGFQYAPVIVRAYGQNSATASGRVRVKSAYDTTGVELSGFPIGSYGWVSGTINCYCESTIQDLAGSATTHGFQKGLAAGDDTAAETDRSSALDDRLNIQIKGTAGGEEVNTLTIQSIQAVYE